MRLRVAGDSLKLKHMEGVRFLAISDQLSKLPFHVSSFLYNLLQETIVCIVEVFQCIFLLLCSIPTAPTDL